MSTRLGTSDYLELAVKPANNDGFGVFDTSVNQHKTIYYSTLKSLFVKADELTDITANQRFMTGYYLFFGSAPESSIVYNGTDMVLGPMAAAPTAKLKLRCNATDFLVLDPVNSSIKIGTKAINYDGSAGVGINFDASNRPVLLSVLQCNAGIALKLKNISYSGASSTGLQFDASNFATFNQKCTFAGLVVIQAHIQMTDKNISYTGAVNTGLEFTASNYGLFNQRLTVTDLLTANSGIDCNGGGIAMDTNCISGSGLAGTGIAFLGGPARVHAYDYIECDSYIEATTNLIGGSTSYVQIGLLKIKDGVTAPGTLPGWAWIYVDTADGDLKVKFGDGTVKTIVTDT